MHHVSVPMLIGEIVFGWTFFWKGIYWLAPPREWFNSPKYDRFLQIVYYYGSLNIRGILVKLFYGAQPQDAPPVPRISTTPVDTSLPKA